MYLQDVALDLIFQLQSLNQLDALTYNQLKEKLVNLSRPRLPQHKAEMETNLVQKYSEESVDEYFLRK